MNKKTVKKTQEELIMNDQRLKRLFTADQLKERLNESKREMKLKKEESV